MFKLIRRKNLIPILRSILIFFRSSRMFLFDVLKGARVETVRSTIYKISASVIAWNVCMSSELVLQDLAADKLKLECITAHLGFNSVCVQKRSLRLAADKYRSVKWGCRHDFYGSWHLYICRSLLGHSTFFVASLVFVKGASCCIITRNFKWN